MKTAIAAAFLASLIVDAGVAQAMPLVAAGDITSPTVIRVAGGCGPERFRNAAGACQVVKGAVAVPGPAVATPPRVCPARQVLSRTGNCRPI